MRNIACILLVAAGCSTKANPNACAVSTDCDQGLICRGGQCIAEACTGSQDCDAAAPYCVVDLCSAACTDDAQCPGFGDATNEPFCVSGTCVECKVATDCAATTPVCDSGACRGCERPDECASGACGDDGTCIDEPEIAFASATGSGTAACTRAAPCSFAHALTVGKPTIELLPGTYLLAGTLSVSGNHLVVGAGATTIVTSTAAGPILSIAPNANVTFDHFVVSGASTNGSSLGDGIASPSLPQGARTLTLRHMSLTQNAEDGVRAYSSTVTASSSEISGNGTAGMHLTDSTANLDGCTIAENIGSEGGLYLDGGAYTVTNSFVVRNSTGITISAFPNQVDVVELDTFADNAQAAITCNDDQPLVTNSLFARNGAAPSMCTLTANMTATDVSLVKFKSPDLAPYDYHLQHGSVAIDAAGTSTIDHDVDGDVRPLGAARDVGADELE